MTPHTLETLQMLHQVLDLPPVSEDIKEDPLADAGNTAKVADSAPSEKPGNETAKPAEVAASTAKAPQKASPRKPAAKKPATRKPTARKAPESKPAPRRKPRASSKKSEEPAE